MTTDETDLRMQGYIAPITVQNPGKWLTWNICTGGIGNTGDAGMYWVLSINMNDEDVFFPDPKGVEKLRTPYSWLCVK